jgi:hypothetical protein
VEGSTVAVAAISPAVSKEIGQESRITEHISWTLPHRIEAGAEKAATFMVGGEQAVFEKRSHISRSGGRFSLPARRDRVAGRRRRI